MNEEIEIKVGVENPDHALSILNEKAEFISSKDQRDEYFVKENEDYFKEEPTKKYLRVRFDDRNSIAFHYCHYDGSKLLKTDEYESEISNPEAVYEIFKLIGLIPKVTVVKHRKTFIYKDFEIVLDHVENLGYFVEVEALKPQEAKETLEECYSVLEELEIKWQPCPDMGYPDMVLAD